MKRARKPQEWEVLSLQRKVAKKVYLHIYLRRRSVTFLQIYKGLISQAELFLPEPCIFKPLIVFLKFLLNVFAVDVPPPSFKKQ